MAAIKRSTAGALRNGARAGRKVMLAWDKACIDYRHWLKLKHTHGIYFTTCEKSNSAAQILSVDLFHELKSKLKERKSWASSPEARKSHAIFECLTHNLLLLFEKHIENNEGFRDEVEERKQAGRTKASPGTIVQAVRNFINSALTRATQRTQRFIRWVRVRLYLDVPWSESVARLRELWTQPA